MPSQLASPQSPGLAAMPVSLSPRHGAGGIGMGGNGNGDSNGNAGAAMLGASSGGSSGGGASRPPIVKRHSSQSSHGGSRNQVTSPGSAGEHHPLRHTVGGGRQRHAKLVLPRNHSSGRNLAKMGRQAAAAQQAAAVGAGHAAQVAEENGRRQQQQHHVRQRSHEGDTEIRLPGSLDESRPVLRRNMTANELPRTKSGAKLKKNLSHGQLTRLSSGRNLAGLGGGGQKAPPSPGLKGRKQRPRSEEVVPREKDLHEQEVELLREQQERKASREGGGPAKKVGFAVGSVGGESEEDGAEGEEAAEAQMDGSGMQEDEWTEESASASPLSTRQNTANNSRRPSMVAEKPPDPHGAQSQHPNVSLQPTKSKQDRNVKDDVRQAAPEADGTPAKSEASSDEEMPSPTSMPAAPLLKHEQPPFEDDTLQIQKQPPQPKPHVRSPLHGAKQHTNPTAKRLTSAQMPAPALVSSVSALDNVHSSKTSPTPSLHSARSITGVDGTADPEDSQELVSRFLPSTSHPSTGSASNTHAMNTPRTGSFHSQTPESESVLHRRNLTGTTLVGGGPVSPGSTRSGSSGATTPALGRSRIELRMLHEKALADREEAAERQPLVPHHIYDRRNETLKSYLNLSVLNGGVGGIGGGGFDGKGRMSPSSSSSMTTTTALQALGPEIFQGRFKAVNTELKVVQRFRDPMRESIERLRRCRGTRLSSLQQLQGQRGSPQKLPPAQGGGEMKMSKSAVSLPARPRKSGEGVKLSTSASPPKGAMASSLTSGVGASQGKNGSPLVKNGNGNGVLGSGKGGVQFSSPGGGRRGGAGGGQARPPKRGVSFAGSEPEMRQYERYEGDGQEDEMGADGVARVLWDSVGM